MATRTDSGWSTFFIITIFIAVVATWAFIPPALIRSAWAAERAEVYAIVSTVTDRDGVFYFFGQAS